MQGQASLRREGSHTKPAGLALNIQEKEVREKEIERRNESDIERDRERKKYIVTYTRKLRDRENYIQKKRRQIKKSDWERDEE